MSWSWAQAARFDTSMTNFGMEFEKVHSPSAQHFVQRRSSVADGNSSRSRILSTRSYGHDISLITFTSNVTLPRNHKHRVKKLKRKKIVRYFDCYHFTIARSSYRILNLTENFVDPWQSNLYNLIFFFFNKFTNRVHLYIAIPSAKHTWPMAERYWAGSTRESPTRLPPPPPFTHHSSRQVSNPFEIFFMKNS